VSTQIGTQGEFDLQPDPRLLQMLGEIDLDPWRCVAELVDNGIDGFLHADRAGSPVQAPAIDVTLPKKGAIEPRVVVHDNGPGMDGPTLEKAMRAGYSGNNPIDSLGLFGMGFNIATARLGATTTVWTTRAGDDVVHGVQIDFADLRSRDSFKTPHLVQSKSDPSAHYTRIEISNLKLDQREQIESPAEQRTIRAMLARSYASMLREHGDPIHFSLTVNDAPLEGKRHCVWGEERVVDVPGVGSVSAFRSFNHKLHIDSVVCTNCLASMLATDVSNGQCLSCGRSDTLEHQERHIRGWIGLQRYLSTNEFGIDFIRNGRKIEIANKELFLWTQDGVVEPEYPIDDQRNRGRFVGEVHIDHCPVDYSKSRFTREHRSWREMVSFIRGDGPLRPNIAEQRGFGPNNSILATHFKAFRRTSPASSQAGGWARVLVVPSNERATEMARRFDKGDPEYQTDAKWWELVKEEDEKKLYGDGGNTPGGGDAGAGPGGIVDDLLGTTGDQGGEPEPTEEEPPKRDRVASLSQAYELPKPLNQSFDVEALRAEDGDPVLESSAWKFVRESAKSKQWQFIFNPEHEAFASMTLGPLDALLAELAWQTFEITRGTNREMQPGDALAKLRRAYAGSQSLEPTAIAQQAAKALDDLCSALLASVPAEDRLGLFEDLPDEGKARVTAALYYKGAPPTALENGSFLRFFPEQLLPLVELRPDLFFDGSVYDTIYETLDLKNPEATTQARRAIRDRLRALISDAVWATSFDKLDPPSRDEMTRAVTALRLLVPDRAFE
jgi:hypothetical protein